MRQALHIALIGNGNVGTYLKKSLEAAGYYTDVFSRKALYDSMPLHTFADKMPKYELVLLCVSDDAIAEVSAALEVGSYLIAHVSGSRSLSALHTKHTRRAVFYPLMSLKADSMVKPAEIPFCLEADTPADVVLLAGLVKTLEAQWFPVSSAQRQQLHLAAVFAHNFGNHMFTLAQEILHASELDFKIMLPLLKQNLDMLQYKNALELQTGPAVRLDRGTINKQLALLQKEDLKNLYLAITKSIQHTHEH